MLDQMSSLIVLEYSFLIEDCYSMNTFVGMLIDTRAIEVSIAGYAQYLAYWRIAKRTIINLLIAG